MSYIITKIMDGIQKNGNAKFYFRNVYSNAVQVLDFKVDKKGNLSIHCMLEHYDLSFSDGETINNNAKLMHSYDMNGVDYADAGLDNLISIILEYTFSVARDHKTFVVSESNNKKLNTGTATKKIFDSAISMLEPTPKALQEIADEYLKVDARYMDGTFLRNAQKVRVLNTDESDYVKILEEEIDNFFEALKPYSEENEETSSKDARKLANVI